MSLQAVCCIEQHCYQFTVDLWWKMCIRDTCSCALQIYFYLIWFGGSWLAVPAASFM